MRRATLLAGLAVASVACGSDDAASTTAAPITAAPITAAPTTAVPATAPPSTAPPSTAAPTTVADSSRTLFDFVEAGSLEGWANVNDTVMGGVSSSTSTWDAGQMVFAGDLSLENNGGFTSVRGPIDERLGNLLAGAAAISVQATGDGKTYLLQLRTVDDQLYVQRFTTVADTEQTSSLDLSAFEPVGRFLDPLPGAEPLDPSRVAQVVIYLLDKQDGPFRLAIRRIAAV
jgi:NADH dehydrogenase [ubiquinone] 1 alpha subcomplex assembly factor 1